jgi:CubicO group peptidase (beta-lactamase class C family)
MKYRLRLFFPMLFFAFYSWGTNLNQKVDDYLQAHTNFCGAVLIAQDNKIIFKKCYGYASYEFHIPNNFDTKFPIASNTKTFTAIAIMQLQEKGLLHVQDRVSKYIPGISNEVTIHHLLTHTSGIPNYSKHWDSLGKYDNISDMIAVIKNWNLEFESGSQYAYCNTGYLVLAYIIEKVSGQSFALYIDTKILQPLGMEHSGSISDENVISKKASGYQNRNGKLCNAPSIINPRSLLGSGDLYASIDDMYQWIYNLFSGKMINEDSLKTVLTPHILTGSSQHRFYGYGCFIDSICDRKCVEHGGGLVGYTSKVMHFIDDNISIIILTNCEDLAQFSKICDEIPNIIFEKTNNLHYVANSERAI